MASEKTVWISPNSLKADRSYVINGVTINEYLLKNHNVNSVNLPTKRTNNFKGVVIHNTNRAGSVDDGRQYTAATLNGAMASRTHYYVTEKSAWRNLEDDVMNWTCGDGTKGEGNNGCISLEIIMNSRTKEEDLKARDNGAKLAAAILAANNMGINDLYTHNYFLNIRDGVKGDYNKLCTTATPTRNCPYYIVHEWEDFRQQVKQYINQLKGKVQEQAPKATVKTTENKNYIFKSTSHAAIRKGPSKSSTLVNRVQMDLYYPATIVSDKWIRHADTEYYSMLSDGAPLFERISPYERKIANFKLNIRCAPTTKSDIVVTVEKGTLLYVLDETPINNDGFMWKRVVINNKLGYVASEYLTDERL